MSIEVNIRVSGLDCVSALHARRGEHRREEVVVEEKRRLAACLPNNVER